MANIQKRIVKIEMNPHAKNATEEYVKKYTDAMILQSKTLATLEGVDEVQRIHVDKAQTIVLNTSNSKNRSRDIYLLAGSVLLGAAFQGIITEYSNNRPNWMLIYFVAGVIGLYLVFLGFRKWFAEAAKELNLSIPRIHDFIRESRLPAEKLGKQYVIKREDLELVRGRQNGRPPKKKDNTEK